ncbi:flagellar motor switch protein FliN [Oceanisphaera sp. W20_SRM_FM3]|uniref:flagellar motor switch protein FliN n=1 Tax=Oceanisphaera sp. W20_SRM_FM3 TaxID=3240267 RepID=UPI003F9502A3
MAEQDIDSSLLLGEGLDSLFQEAAVEPEDSESNQSSSRGLDYFQQLPVRVSLEVASAEISLGELMQAGEGAVIELDRMAGEPLDVKVNGTLLAQGEVVLANGRYGVRLTRVFNQAASKEAVNEA